MTIWDDFNASNKQRIEETHQHMDDMWAQQRFLESADLAMKNFKAASEDLDHIIQQQGASGAIQGAHITARMLLEWYPVMLNAARVTAASFVNAMPSPAAPNTPENPTLQKAAAKKFGEVVAFVNHRLGTQNALQMLDIINDDIAIRHDSELLRDLLSNMREGLKHGLDVFAPSDEDLEAQARARNINPRPGAEPTAKRPKTRRPNGGNDNGGNGPAGGGTPPTLH